MKSLFGATLVLLLTACSEGPSSETSQTPAPYLPPQEPTEQYVYTKFDLDGAAIAAPANWKVTRVPMPTTFYYKAEFGDKRCRLTREQGVNFPEVLSYIRSTPQLEIAETYVDNHAKSQELSAYYSGAKKISVLNAEKSIKEGYAEFEVLGTQAYLPESHTASGNEPLPAYGRGIYVYYIFSENLTARVECETERASTTNLAMQFLSNDKATFRKIARKSRLQAGMN